MNKKLVIGISVILLLIILAAGCIDSVHAKEEFNKRFTITYEQNLDNINMLVIHDNVNNVTCYKYLASISCLTDLTIKQGD